MACVPTARERVRAELTAEIADAARRQLAEVGAAALSLRAVAREVGMVSSAVYRYFASRDELLTRLIIDGYDAVGAAVEAADDPAASPEERWTAVCTAVRDWARAHPHEYALLYGSPVPGYAAPRTTIGPASRVGEVLCRIAADGVAVGAIDAGPDGTGADLALHPGIAARMGLPDPSPSTSLAARAIFAWTALFGMIGFELFGHTRNVVDDHRAYFDDAVDRLATSLGVLDPATP